MDDFKNHPTTLGEVKSDRSGKGSDWTPRDALVRALRDLDSGEWKPESVFISMTEKVGEDSVVNRQYYAAGPSALHIVGTIEVCKNAYLIDGHEMSKRS